MGTFKTLASNDWSSAKVHLSETEKRRMVSSNVSLTGMTDIVFAVVVVVACCGLLEVIKSN